MVEGGSPWPRRRPSPARRARPSARLELAQFAPDAPLDRVLARACELSADALAVERVGVWLFIDDRSVLRCADLYERSKGEHSSGALLRVADFPTYFASLSLRKAIPAEVAGTEPWTAELGTTYLRPLDITSMLDAGIFVDGILVGVVCHENVGTPREWTTEARDFAGSIADLLALRLQSGKVRELQAAFLTQGERIAAQEKTSAMAQLAAGVAHDFRNLLTVFLTTGHLIAERPDIPREVREHGASLIATAERGIELATELMEFARPASRPPTVSDLAEVTGEILPVLQATAGTRHEVRFRRAPALGKVLVGKAHFTRLLLNLVVNAREAMPRGGLIEVRRRPVKLKGNPSYTGRFVLLEVRDHGVGMDEESRRRAFEPFYSTKSRGSGLGLAICRQIVERAGGFVRVESAPGRGSTFQVFFPSIGASTGGTGVFTVPPELRSSDGA